MIEARLLLARLADGRAFEVFERNEAGKVRVDFDLADFKGIERVGAVTFASIDPSAAKRLAREVLREELDTLHAHLQAAREESDRLREDAARALKAAGAPKRPRKKRGVS